MKREDLLKRLEEITKSFSTYKNAVALLALGSIGENRDRLDQYSDLDFFAIVENGTQLQFLNDLGWLSGGSPLVYQFKNTKDGYKIMYEDGIYGEFAVFEEKDLSNASFAKGRIIWVKEEKKILPYSSKPFPKVKKDSIEYAFNEALTNIYVGLLRYHRGEKLSAYFMIERYAFDNILSVLHLLIPEREVFCDPFNLSRRFELRYSSHDLLNSLQGYEDILSSTNNLLTFILKYYQPNETLLNEILKLLKKD